MKGVQWHALMWLGLVGLVVSASYLSSAPQPGIAGTVQKDVKALYQLMLEWAVLAKPLPGQSARIAFPDHHLIKDASLIRVSSKNLPPEVHLSLPHRQIQVLAEETLEQMADEVGEFPAFHFSEVKIFEEFAELGLELRWFLSKSSQVVPLSGGGVRIRFRWQGGQWRFEKRFSMWISLGKAAAILSAISASRGSTAGFDTYSQCLSPK